jgi:hypothetical protein
MDVDEIARMPEANESATVRLIGTEDQNKMLRIERTKACNPQQGTMLFSGILLRRRNSFSTILMLRLGTYLRCCTRLRTEGRKPHVWCVVSLWLIGVFASRWEIAAQNSSVPGCQNAPKMPRCLAGGRSLLRSVGWNHIDRYELHSISNDVLALGLVIRDF